MFRLFSSTVLVSALLVAPAAVQARVTGLVVHSRSLAFGGAAFGTTGQYELLAGELKFEADPLAARNANLADIHLAPKNPRGNVEYTADVLILKPLDVAKGNGRFVFEAVNRGRMLSLRTFNAASSPDLSTAAAAGNGFLLRGGYSVIAMGWQARYPVAGAPVMSIALGSRLPAAAGTLAAELPVAIAADGAAVTGATRESFIDTGTVNPFVAYLTYAAANADRSTLTVRQTSADAPQTPVGMSWRYLDDWRVEVTRPPGAGFDSGAIYEFSYIARDPIVYGLALAAMRDAASFFKYESTDGQGNANPLALTGRQTARTALAFGASQTGRTLKTLLYEFNDDEQGRQVFDGAHIHISGASMNSQNSRFAHPGQKSGQHSDAAQPGDQFPFTYATLFDPVSRRTDGLLARCTATHTCPKIIHSDSENEVWHGGSLVYTDTQGRDVAIPGNVRVYLYSSTQHSPGPTGRGMCQQLQNPLDYGPLNRALFTALDEWVTRGRAPPDSRYPQRGAGTLVDADQSSTGFPQIPGVAYNGLVHRPKLTDYGVFPPAQSISYPAFVPRVDADGNTLAGVRLPALEAPLATYTGWNLRAAGHAMNELCMASGSYIPLPQTRAQRAASGDPRLSIEERYTDEADYLRVYRRATQQLLRSRFVLAEDVTHMEEAAQRQWRELQESRVAR